ncbi:hypothetical protein FQA39_LY17566 [Lamprigera yunnana]|nr:hypothetical protein FQA39_LY17566 [Lamprigera yunnana]
MSLASKSTINPKRRAFFNNLNDVWWNLPGLKVLINVNNLLMPYIQDQIIGTGITKPNQNAPLDGLNILEVGCGGGIISEQLARRGCTLTAIDIGHDLIDLAKGRAKVDPILSKINYLTEAIEDHCKNNAQAYDVVISSFVVEHVDDQEYFIKCCAECVKPTGSLFISAAADTFWAWLILIFLSEVVFKTALRGISDRGKFINVSTIEEMIKSHDFDIVRTRGIINNPITQSTWWVPTTAILYMTHAVKKIN